MFDPFCCWVCKQVNLNWPDEVISFSVWVKSLVNFDLASYTNLACTVQQYGGDRVASSGGGSEVGGGGSGGGMQAYQWLLIELSCLMLLLFALFAVYMCITSCLGLLWCCNCACSCAVGGYW
jgi:hypothetical protein